MSRVCIRGDRHPDEVFRNSSGDRASLIHYTANSLMRVLVVEDEPKVADALRHGLEAEHYEVLVEYTGKVHSRG